MVSSGGTGRYFKPKRWENMEDQPEPTDRHKQKKFRWVIGATGILLVLMGVFILLSAQMLKQTVVTEKIKTAVSRAVTGDVEFQRIDLSIFPRPKLIFQGCRVSIPGKAEITIPSLTIRPQILPLLTGRFQAAVVKADAPDIEWTLQKSAKETPGRPDRVSLKAVEKQVTAALGLVVSIPTDFTFDTRGGRLNILKDDESIFRARNINARFTRLTDSIDIDFQCRSEHWDHMTLSGRINPKDLKSRGRIVLKGAQPQSVVAYLLPDLREKLDASPIDLTLRFQAEGLNVLDADLQATLHTLTLKNGREKFVVRGNQLKGKVYLNKTHSSFSLSELQLEHPRMTVSGRLNMGSIVSPGPAPAHLELRFVDVDLSATRKAARVAAGEVQIVQRISKILKGGKAPRIEVSAAGTSVADMGKGENVLIKGRLMDGRVYIPGAKLDLEAVQGDVVISGGFLQGDNLEARVGNTQGRKGVLTLTQTDGEVLFRLDIDVTADLAQLPPMLRQWIDNDSFKGEMDRLDHLQGQAAGKLILEGDASALNVQVDISEFSLSAAYSRLPYPLEIQGGQLTYRPTGIAVKNLRGRLGQSSFSELSAGITWEKDHHLKILSGQAEIHAAEIHPWLSAFERMTAYKSQVKDIRGIVSLTAMQLDGPLLEPEKWQFKTTGAAKNLTVSLRRFPGPLVITRGNFSAAKDAAAGTFSFRDVQTGLIHSALNLSGTLHNDVKGLNTADLHFQGGLHPEFIQWVYAVLDLPFGLTLRGPLSVSESRLTWTRDRQTTFRGNLSVQDGPDVVIDLLVSSEAFKINELTIRDGESRADFKLHVGQNRLHTAFSGYLTAKTLSALVINYPATDGWIRGDIQADIFMDPPIRATAKGKLAGRCIRFPYPLTVPLEINSISFNGLDDLLVLEEADFTWEDHHLSLKGTAERSGPSWLIDLSLAADDLNWDRLKRRFTRFKKIKDSESAGIPWTSAVHGKIRLKAEKLTVGSYTWAPVHADITLAPEGIVIAVTRADLCGISTPGVLKIAGRDIQLEFKPFSKDGDLAATVACLKKGETLVTGKYDLSGTVSARATTGSLINALRGPIDFRASNGRIYRHIPLAKLFSYLDVMEIFKKVIPTLQKEGLAYRSMIVTGVIEKGNLHLTEAIIDSPTMGIVCQGSIDLVHETMDLDVLVAPMQTVNFLIKNVPVVSQIMGGNLFSIPLEIKGSFSDPEVTALPIKQVGKGLLGMMKRTIQLPFKLLQPFISGE